MGKIDILIDKEQFHNEVLAGYLAGTAENELPADEFVARSIIPPGTGALRDFSYIAPEIPEYIPQNCVGCMECVTECPDTAILGKVVEEDTLNEYLKDIDDIEKKEKLKTIFTKTQKYHTVYEKKTGKGGLFGIFVDPTKCKGCGECVEVCGDHNALKMVQKNQNILNDLKTSIDFYRKLPETPQKYINERVLVDMMLAERSLLYVGGAGSCAGCGEASVLRMMSAATGFVYGKNSFGIVAATGCNTVYSSAYPFNPFMVPWINSLFENVATVAMGVRSRWNQRGWGDKKIWAVGGDGAILDIGFQALSRMLASGMNINVLVLDTQVYSNTGGQASTSTFKGQNAKMSAHGKVLAGKVERRKDLAKICMMHPEVYVAQTTAALPNHFYRSIMAANEYEGPSVVISYCSCQPEHGIGDDMSSHQAKLAVNSRVFPLIEYDPRRGKRLRERLSLKGNPNVKDDWYYHPKTKEPIDFIYWAKTEGRFAKHFDKDGNPSELLKTAQEEVLENWRTLQEMAGII